jgi:hypothetical protein
MCDGGCYRTFNQGLLKSKMVWSSVVHGSRPDCATARCHVQIVNRCQLLLRLVVGKASISRMVGAHCTSVYPSSFRCFSEFTPFLLLPVVVYMDDGVWRDWDQEHVDRDAVACGAPQGRQSFLLREMGEITGLEQPEEDGIFVQRDRR